MNCDDFSILALYCDYLSVLEHVRSDFVNAILRLGLSARPADVKASIHS